MAEKSDKIVFCACHDMGVHILTNLIEWGFNIRHIVTLTPEQAKKNRVSGYFDFRNIAKELGIPVYVPTSYSLTADADIAFFREYKFDLLVQGGWQRLFPEPVLTSLRIGAIGGHGSADLLPKGRGRSPMNWSLLEGKTRFIMQLFLIRAGIDDGPIFDSEAFDINLYDDIKTLYYKNSIVTLRMLRRSIPLLTSGQIKLQPQIGLPSYYPKRTEEEGIIDWESMDIGEINNLIRALAPPYPCARGIVDGKATIIRSAQIFDTRILYPRANYGEIVERFGSDLIVNCLGGLLLIRDYEFN